MSRYHSDCHAVLLKCITLVEGYDTSFFYAEILHGYKQTVVFSFKILIVYGQAYLYGFFYRTLFHCDEITFATVFVIKRYACISGVNAKMRDSLNVFPYCRLSI